MDKITIERERFEKWALLHHSMRDHDWFIESAKAGTLADDLTDSWASWRAALAAQPAEPVAAGPDDMKVYDAIAANYAAPAAVPLTDEQLFDLLRRIDPMTVRLPPGYRAFARAIERAHGIGDKT